MILSRLSEASRYDGVHPLFPKAFAYLRDFDPATPDGKYPISGDDLVAVVQRYETGPEATKAWESHRIHADIQYIVSGSERMFVAATELLAGGSGYNSEKDVEKYQGAGAAPVTELRLAPGDMAFFFPEDGHKPNCEWEAPCAVLKVVLKVRL